MKIDSLSWNISQKHEIQLSCDISKLPFLKSSEFTKVSVDFDGDLDLKRFLKKYFKIQKCGTKSNANKI